MKYPQAEIYTDVLARILDLAIETADNADTILVNPGTGTVDDPDLNKHMRELGNTLTLARDQAEAVGERIRKLQEIAAARPK